MDQHTAVDPTDSKSDTFSNAPQNLWKYACKLLGPLDKIRKATQNIHFQIQHIVIEQQEQKVSCLNALLIGTV